MPHARFAPDGEVVQIGADESLLDAALRAGIPHAHVCGGAARCSTCRVRVVAGLGHCAERTAAEHRIAERLHFGPDIRLACQTSVNGDVELRRLVLDPEDVELADHQRPSVRPRRAGEEKVLAILFADIRGFTSFAEELPAYDVIHSLGRYFQRMDPVIRRHGGYIDNYMGDGLMAIFGADDAPGAARRAVEAGLEMLAEVERLAPYFESSYGRRFDIGVGIHYGTAVMGTIEPPGHDKVTAIGDAVNLASRIEAANKRLGTRLLISAATRAAVGDGFELRRHDGVELPGKAGAHELWEVTGRRGE
jgi:adenylate cyclase